MARPLRVSIEAFALEVTKDLPRLVAEHPAGIYISDLQVEYGESTARIKSMFKVLARGQVISVRQSTANAYYIVPAHLPSDVPFPELTDLQRSLSLLLISFCSPTIRAVKTNYSWLARRLMCSNGGIKASIARLDALGYLHIIAPSHRGHSSDLVLQLGEPLFDHLLTLETSPKDDV